MYDRHLETFVKVADCGSFLKASEQLYISANAVTKQINLLEDRLELKLFLRSTQGLVLTEAGKLIYDESKKLIRHTNTVLRKARELEAQRSFTIHIGVSLMNPANILLKQWGKAAARYPNIKLEIVPFEDTVPAFQEVLDHLGQKIDLISCPYDTNYWGDRYQSFHLQDLPLCVACSKNHPLASKERLTIQDLYGQTLLLSQRGLTAHQDRIWEELERDHPQIHLQGVPYLDINVFNQLPASQHLIHSAECWSGVHPLVATLPVEWDYKMPYGLIYAKDPPREVLQFIMAVGQPESE